MIKLTKNERKMYDQGLKDGHETKCSEYHTSKMQFEYNKDTDTLRMIFTGDCSDIHTVFQGKGIDEFMDLANKLQSQREFNR